MTVFEKLAPFLVAALVIATGVVGWLCVRMELRLAARRRVTLENYRRDNHLFYVKKDAATSVIAGGAALLSLAMLILCLCLPLLRIYWLALALLLAVDAAVVWLSLSRERCARDVRVFDAYYVEVESLLANKTRTLSNMKACRTRVAELRARLEATRAAFDRHLAHKLDASDLERLFAPLDKMLDDHSAEVDRFSREITQSFSVALLDFLTANIQPELKVVPLGDFDRHTVDDLLDRIKVDYGKGIAATVIAEVNAGQVSNARSLGEIMTLLHELEVRVEGETLKQFLLAASRFEDRGALMLLLYRNRQIPAAMVIDTLIPEGWDWAFLPGMAAAFNRRELHDILAALLEGDRTEMCAQLLLGFEPSQLELLDELLSVGGAREHNSAFSHAGAVRLLLSHRYAVGNSANLYETLALFLFERCEALGCSPQEGERITRIVTAGEFLAHREEIVGYYRQAASRAAALITSAERVVLQYLVAPDAGFLSSERLAATFEEYRFTLSLGEITVLRALLAAFLLLRSKSERCRAVVLAELGAIPAAKGLTAEGGHEEIARTILAHLREKELPHLRTLLCRTEAGRRTLDTVFEL